LNNRISISSLLANKKSPASGRVLPAWVWELQKKPFQKPFHGWAGRECLIINRIKDDRLFPTNPCGRGIITEGSGHGLARPCPRQAIFRFAVVLQGRECFWCFFSSRSFFKQSVQIVRGIASVWQVWINLINSSLIRALPQVL